MWGLKVEFTARAECFAAQMGWAAWMLGGRTMWLMLHKGNSHELQSRWQSWQTPAVAVSDCFERRAGSERSDAIVQKMCQQFCFCLLRASAVLSHCCGVATAFLGRLGCSCLRLRPVLISGPCPAVSSSAHLRAASCGLFPSKRFKSSTLFFPKAPLRPRLTAGRLSLELTHPPQPPGRALDLIKGHQPAGTKRHATELPEASHLPVASGMAPAALAKPGAAMA